MAQVSNPRKGFNFSIQIAPLPIDPWLAQKVTIPQIEVEKAAHGDTNHDIKTGGRVKYNDIKIEKIMRTSGSDNYFFDWAASVADVVIGGGLTPTLYKRVITITELAEDGTTPINVWVCGGCWPTKINDMGLDRMSSENSIESIDISVDTIEKL
jgi:phage tail-like protein